MEKRIVCVSDIHGCYDEFLLMLKKVNYQAEHTQLILLGDYVDRGKNSKEVLQFIKDLVSNEGAIALKGNHDQMFCDWLESPEKHMERYLRNGGLETIQSFLSLTEVEKVEQNWTEWAQKIKEENIDLIDFVQSLPHYYETEHYIFVHAGIRPTLVDWKETPTHDLIWIREEFLDHPHQLSQQIVHGHTPNIYLNDKADIFERERKIGIDGGCVYGYQLNCLEITEARTHQHHSVPAIVKVKG